MVNASNSAVDFEIFSSRSRNSHSLPEDFFLISKGIFLRFWHLSKDITIKKTTQMRVVFGFIA